MHFLMALLSPAEAEAGRLSHRGTVPQPPPDWPSQGSPWGWGPRKWKLRLSEESCWEPPVLEAQPQHPGKCEFQQSPSQGLRGARRRLRGLLRLGCSMCGTFAFGSPVGTGTTRLPMGCG